MRVCESSKLQSVFFFASQTLDEVAVRVAGGVRGIARLVLRYAMRRRMRLTMRFLCARCRIC
jgi:hypothetical protein